MVVLRGATDHGFETAVSMIGMATRRSSAPTTVLSTGRTRAAGRGGRTCARTRAAPGDIHNVCAGIHGRCSWSARSAHGELTGRTAVASGRRSLAFVERAQAANAADARADGGDVDHDGGVGTARDEGHAGFAAAATGDGAQRRAGCTATAGGGKHGRCSDRTAPARSAATPAFERALGLAVRDLTGGRTGRRS